MTWGSVASNRLNCFVSWVTQLLSWVCLSIYFFYNNCAISRALIRGHLSSIRVQAMESCCRFVKLHAFFVLFWEGWGSGLGVGIERFISVTRNIFSFSFTYVFCYYILRGKGEAFTISVPTGCNNLILGEKSCPKKKSTRKLIIVLSNHPFLT